MTATPATALKGSRCQTLFSTYIATLAQNTTTEVLGQSDAGLPVRYPGRMIGMYVSGESAGGTNGQTITWTAYKGSVAAGNKVYETVLTQTGAADAFSSDNTTPAVSEAVCTFAAGDDLIITCVTSATTGNVVENSVVLHFEPSI